jgi:HSP20 family protein
MRNNWNPFDQMESLFEQMATGAMFGPSSVSVDVHDDEDQFVLIADVPGYSREDIDVVIDRTAVTLRASTDRVDTDEVDATEYAHHRASFSRTVTLPVPVDSAETTATYKNGVLTVSMPKLTVENGVTIPVDDPPEAEEDDIAE